MIRRLLIMFSLVVFLVLPVQAKDIDGQFAVFGAGSKSCEAYLKARATRSGISAYVNWMEAYLSAFNLIVPSTYNIAGTRNLDQMLKWTDDYCKENPQDLYVNAVAALTVALYPERQNLSPGKDNVEKWKSLKTTP